MATQVEPRADGMMGADRITTPVIGDRARSAPHLAAEEPRQNPFSSPAIASGYGAWYETAGRRADLLEKELLRRLLDEFPMAHTLLEVGCGTGHFTRWFKVQEPQVVEEGMMSSLILGEEAAVFNGLEDVFHQIAAEGAVVMTVTYSNVCPAPEVSEKAAG